MSNQSLVIIKPDGVSRRLSGEIISRLEAKDLSITRMEKRTIDAQTAAQHYIEHKDKPFYGDLIEFITSGPSVVMVVEGRQAQPAIRTMMGKTDPVDSAPGTIRGDLAVSQTENLIHGSDSPESATREIALFFG